ncbi:MAG TPA: MFS transporter [Gammaproteobacteria bacterium]
MLCAAPFVDEIAAGVPTLAAADVRDGLGVGYGAVAAVVLSLPLLLSWLVEPPLLLAAKRVGRRRMAAAGFAVMALGNLAAAAAGSAWQLALSLACAAAAGGVALSLVETALMDAAPAERERWMTRWTIGGALGDLAAPGVLALAAFAGVGWRGAFVAAAVLAAGAACALPSHIGEHDGHEGAPSLRPLAALRRALGTRRLLVWCCAAAVCDLLDEILVVVAVLFLRDARALDSAATALAMAVVPAAGALGLLLAERLLRRLPPLAYLAANCAICAPAIGALACLPSAAAAVVLLGVIGFTAACMWPIAAAQAYRALPDDSAAVAAVGRLLTPLTVAMPVAVAAAADAWGPAAAVLLLAVQPLALLALSLSPRRGRREPPERRSPAVSLAARR